MARIEIDLDAKCKKCGDKGTAQNGLCLGCITKLLNDGKLDRIIDKLKKRKEE